MPFYQILFLSLLAALAPAQPDAAACDGPAYHQFDFFLGDWDTYDVTDSTTVVARNTVTPMVGGCAIRESYRQNDGMVGESFSTYDASRGVWHQSWVTSRGELLLLEGKLQGNRMVLTAPEHAANGDSSLIRGIWEPLGPNVRETAERSHDGGKTWAPVFDIIFRPHRARSDSAGIVALEQRWLAARDTATLSPILAPDFVHVTPGGAFLNRSEHLAWVAGHPPPADRQARFETLEVRIYGNTAVATGVVRSQAAGGPVRRSAFTDVFVQHPSGWQAVSAEETILGR